MSEVGPGSSLIFFPSLSSFLSLALFLLSISRTLIFRLLQGLSTPTPYLPRSLSLFLLSALTLPLYDFHSLSLFLFLSLSLHLPGTHTHTCTGTHTHLQAHTHTHTHTHIYTQGRRKHRDCAHSLIHSRISSII